MSLIVLGEVLGGTAFTLLVLVLSLWLLSIPLRDISIIDMAFAGLVAVVLLVACRLAGSQGPVPGLIIALVLIWACRMSVYLIHRNWGHGEDPRYTRLRQWVAPGWPFHRLSLRQVFLLQGAVIWVLTLEKKMAREKPGYADYMRKTNGLIPGPPRR